MLNYSQCTCIEYHCGNENPTFHGRCLCWIPFYPFSLWSWIVYRSCGTAGPNFLPKVAGWLGCAPHGWHGPQAREANAPATLYDVNSCHLKKWKEKVKWYHMSAFSRYKRSTAACSHENTFHLKTCFDCCWSWPMALPGVPHDGTCGAAVRGLGSTWRLWPFFCSKHSKYWICSLALWKDDELKRASIWHRLNPQELHSWERNKCIIRVPIYIVHVHA